MKVAYLLLVHENPQLLKRAIEMLSCGGCDFFIHLDLKSDMHRFARIRGQNVHFVEPRLRVHWGEFSQVEATMLLLRQALGSSANYDYFIFLQGSDYPLRSGVYIRNFLEENRGSEFLSSVPMPAPGYPLSLPYPGTLNSVAALLTQQTYGKFTPWGWCDGRGSWDKNDGVTYDSGTITDNTTTNSFSSTVTDSTKTWTTNQWANATNPYSLVDTTQNLSFEIASNTSNTITLSRNTAQYYGNYGTQTWANGDSYQIRRASLCIDQVGRGQGVLLSGWPPTPTGWVNEVLDPVYEWGDTVTGAGSYAIISGINSDSGKVSDNRDYYQFLGPHGVPISFNGTAGVGQGLLSARPSTCTAGPGGNTPGVGYFATDQGSQGTLYVCNPTNTWKVYYTPYTYPHPLTQAGPPSPPTNLTAGAH